MAVEIACRARDIRYGINTYTRPGVLAPALEEDQVGYYPVSYGALKIIGRKVALTSDDVVYDLGCGMGRALCMFARSPLRACIGIELDPILASRARRNAARLRGRRTPILIHEADATNGRFDDGTVYFLYNPFGAASMKRWLAQLRRSLSEAPRTIRIIYANPVKDDVLADCGWLTRIDGFSVPFEVVWKMPVSIWKNADRQTTASSTVELQAA